MANHKTAKIKLKNVIKIGLWDNHVAKEKIAAVYTKLQKQYPDKEVYIANCGFFNMDKTLNPIMGTKINGKELSSEWYNGWIGMKGKNIGYGDPGTSPTGYTDAVTGFPVLITEGKKSKLYSHCIDNTDRGRTMLGFNGEEVILSCIQDTAGSSDFTLDEELTYMLNQKCDYAINLDGGGSSQCIFKGNKISSSRTVSNFIYIIANPVITVEAQAQVWLNTTYGFKLVVDGMLGNATKTALIKAMQKELKVTADGSWGPKSKVAVKALGLKSKNNTVNTVKILQIALCRKGFWFDNIDGKFTEALDTALRNYQKAARLTVDGWAGSATFTSLFK